jgi:polyribonucleotide nucleotidyltransferase
MAQRASTSLGSTTFSLETGKVAKQADGSVVVQQGDTVVLVTAVYASSPKENTFDDFVPLMVDYREKTYAAGRIPGGFFKREGRPTEREILTARLIDRPIRPLFPHGFLHEIQLMAMVLSSDGAYDPDVLAIVGASAALHISSLPFPKPVGAARVGSVEGQLVVNPTYQQLTASPIDVVVAGTSDGILSIEAGFLEVAESHVLEAIRFGYEHVRRLIRLQEELGTAVNRPKAGNLVVREPSTQLIEAVRQRAVEELRRINQLTGKDGRESALDALRTALVHALAPEGGPVSAAEVNLAFGVVERDEVRRHILTQQRRIDGRRFTDLREIQCEVGVLPRTHGSSLFTRGETQSLAVTTLGTRDDEQMIEALEGKSYKRFMLHYNFPPFSVGEVRPVRGPGRREIGHGALAERSLLPMIPTKEHFPYTIRVVSDILESNGSSSMATVCSGSLSLMDAGVPIRAAVSGVAMGLVKEGDQAAILTDISGLEDHLGDMDFKIAGSRKGVTALQVDVKLPAGLTIDLIERIVAQSHPARMAVLDLMAKALETPRPAISVYAPRIVTIKINPERIRDVIGPGGRTIRKIIDETGATINVEDDGSVSVASADSHKSDRALEIIRSLTEEVEVGKIYTGKVKRIMNFGAFCEILPGKEGLIHVSELAEGFVKKVDDVVKIGDEVRVKVVEIDEQGRVNLSRKRVLADEREPAGQAPQVSSRQKGPSDDA